MTRCWLVLQRPDSEYADVFGRAYEYPSRIPNARQVAVGDVLVVALSARDVIDDARIIGLGRVGEIAPTDASRLLASFDRFLNLTPAARFKDIGGDPRSNKTNSINRVDDVVVEKLLTREGLLSIEQAPVVGGVMQTDPVGTPSQHEVREEIFEAVVRDLMGPAEGPDEEVAGTGIRDRYVVGQLEPRGGVLEPEEFDEVARAGDASSEEGQPEADSPQERSIRPSSIGMTFAVDGAVDAIEVTATWGRYRRLKSETILTESGTGKAIWKRSPQGGTKPLGLESDGRVYLVPDERHPAVVVEGTVRKGPHGDWVVTLFLVNGQEVPTKEEGQLERPRVEEYWLFQPELRVSSRDGSAVFRRRPSLDRLDERGTDEALERRLLEMEYRDHVEFAVGHGVSVHADPDETDPRTAGSIVTRFVPWYDVPATESPTLEELPGLRGLVRDMKELAELDDPGLVTTLSVLADEYERWIDEQETRAAGGDLNGFEDATMEASKRWRRALRRIRGGIQVLADDERASDAFRFANRAMWLQRVHSEYALRRRRGEEVSLDDIDQPSVRTWYPFQLAYILIAIPSLTDPTHRDRVDPVGAIADLLWFPTGGGKTEAYLGVAAYAMALRRLQGEIGGFDGRSGVTVIMRYTLRLLTIQQFQRASALMCAMEVIRREALHAGDPRWGLEPFRIGLWVGARSTPNTIKESENAIRDAHKDTWSGGGGGTPYQLTACPWCGSKIEPGRDLLVDKDLGRTLMYCSDKLGGCEFTPRKAKREGLPVVVVDEEIYRLLPALLIGTVDKFAQMPWKGEVQTLFGRVSGECPRHGFLNPESDCNGKHNKKGAFPAVERAEAGPLRPPDLIVQDELHLISGPLGSMVGLYETAVDALCEWQYDGTRIRPKVIASTATIRRAKEQVHGLFVRDVEVFPPRGLDAADNFFARQRPVSVQKPGRRYFGICAPGKSRPAVLIRVYVALLTAAEAAYQRHGSTADPWMTLVGYFNSLRELGGMRRLVEDDVSTRTFRVDREEDLERPGLAGRQLRVIEELTSRRTSSYIPVVLDWLEETFDLSVDAEREAARDRGEKAKRRPIDVLLATNMVSVGVDVQRLGLMAVAGQPKNTAEYIQATSRVGRSSPGLVCSVLNWARPRDLSHYEQFEHYHATFYQHVEALSVTPFAARALDRGLSGLLVSLLRLDERELTPNRGAAELDRHADYADEVVGSIANRAWTASGDSGAKALVEQTLPARLDEWAHEAQLPGRDLVYKTRGKAGTEAPLLSSPSPEGWSSFTVLNSLRDVEPTVTLVLKHGGERASHGSRAPDWEASQIEDADGEASG